MSEITGRETAPLRRFGETSVTLNQFDGTTYLLSVYVADMNYQLHLNQDGVDQLHALFGKFAQVEVEQW